MYMYVCACVFMLMGTVLAEAIRGQWTHWTWIYRQLSAARCGFLGWTLGLLQE